jgi:hypothetical protein
MQVAAPPCDFQAIGDFPDAHSAFISLTIFIVIGF